MKIRVASDLHREFCDQRVGTPFTGRTDVLIVAGDLCANTHIGSELLDLLEVADHIVYVMGNHDYWGDTRQKSIANVRSQIKSDRIHFLENQTVVIKGTTFLGATLWTDLGHANPTVMWTAQRKMHDFSRISRFSPEKSYFAHKESVAWLASTMIPGCVVVTHHAPTFMSIPSSLIGSSLNEAYASDLSNLILDTRPSLWVHGHCHTNSDYLIGDTRVLCNPYGYHGYHVNGGFDPDLIVEIGA